MKIYLYRATNLKSTFLALVHSGSPFLVPTKNQRFLQFIHNQHQLLHTGLLYLEVIPIDAILPAICAFIVGFSCTVCTKMRSLRAH